MKKIVCIMAIISMTISSCNSEKNPENNGEKTEATEIETSATEEKSDISYKTYQYENEIIKIGFSKDMKNVESAVHQIEGEKEETPITLTDFEFSEDLEMFMGIATSKAWEGEMMIGIDRNATTVGLNNGIDIKKVFE